ncbi:hypothetical protein, partial [Collinsella intestinalis]|uniref:hypothetical protein n=1 Tax=Collinsella intestinalis TaxID=147207 RepID=UPI00195C1539
MGFRERRRPRKNAFRQNAVHDLFATVRGKKVKKQGAHRPIPSPVRPPGAGAIALHAPPPDSPGGRTGD